MLYTVISDKPIDAVCAALQEAVTRRQFGVMATHSLRETMAKKGVTFDHDCRIYEVCNPHQAKRVLEKRMEISTALPCRISVFEEGGKVKISTIRPTMMLSMYGEASLQPVAEEVERLILEMMDEAAA